MGWCWWKEWGDFREAYFDKMEILKTAERKFAGQLPRSHAHLIFHEAVRAGGRRWRRYGKQCAQRLATKALHINS